MEQLDLLPIELEGVSQERPLIIAGPCSAETEEQVMTTAKSLSDKGIKIFRAGIWKPRTKPGGFEGIGVEGLSWLKEVKKETGMYVATEVATAKHVYECLKADVDIWELFVNFFFFDYLSIFPGIQTILGTNPYFIVFLIKAANVSTLVFQFNSGNFFCLWVTSQNSIFI